MVPEGLRLARVRSRLQIEWYTACDKQTQRSAPRCAVLNILPSAITPPLLSSASGSSSKTRSPRSLGASGDSDSSDQPPRRRRLTRYSALSASPSVCGHVHASDDTQGCSAAPQEQPTGLARPMPGMRGGSSSQVFQVAVLAFGHPFDRLGDTALPGFVALGFSDPFDVFALATRAERIEHRPRLFVPQRWRKISAAAHAESWLCGLVDRSQEYIHLSARALICSTR